MNYEKLKNEWYAEEKAGFSGWDFSHLNGRWESEKLPWEYKEWVNKYRKPEYKLLDMGTGGGEFLLTLQHPFQNTSVTEEWEPNVKLCKERLEPLGIQVAQVFDIYHLPFEENTFDMIINRHESYDIKEVKRLLKPNGMFATQQVGGENDVAFSKALAPDFVPLCPDFNLQNEVVKCEKKGFKIIFTDEYFSKARFFDVGAIVYFAKIIPWEFPDFSVDKCFEALCKLQKEIEEKGYIEALQHRFIIVAQNTKA